MLRRFVLVGLMVLAQGSIAQIIAGTLLSAFFLLLQVQASPYKHLSDDFLASAASFSLVVVFVCVYAFKDAALTTLPDIQLKLSAEQESIYVIDPAALTAILFGALIGALLVSFGLFGVIYAAEMQRRRRENLAGKARRLRARKDDSEVQAPPLPDGTDFHLFLSHVWGTGQDQMRIVKQQLLEMMPDLSVFLDVDDLKEGRGAEYVDASSSVLIFVSRGYFRSQNCMRELLRAVARGKRLVTMLELESSKGGMAREEVYDGLRAADAHYSQRWGDAYLQSEVREWLQAGWAEPTRGRRMCEALAAGDAVADVLFKALYEDDERVIEWNRIGCFQQVTLRLIAESLLPAEKRGSTYVQGELINKAIRLAPPSGDSTFHLYCSQHNPGAAALLAELAATHSLPLHTRGTPDGGHNDSVVLVLPTRAVPPASGVVGPPPAEHSAAKQAEQPPAEQPPAETRGDEGVHRKGVRFDDHAGAAPAAGESLSRSPAAAESSGSFARSRRKLREPTSLLASTQLDDLPRCEQMLIYLRGDTWVSGERSAAFAQEVRRAMDADIPLLLAHEMPGLGGQHARDGIDFGSFFSSERGATPADLLLRGCYSKIAVPLKGAEWRKASLVLLLEGICAAAADADARASEGSSTRLSWRSSRSERSALAERSLFRRPAAVARTNKMRQVELAAASPSAASAVSHESSVASDSYV